MIETRALRGGLGALALSALLLLSCSTDGERARTPAEAPRERAQEPLETVPAPPPHELAGSAAAIDDEVPADIVPLASRFTPRPLPIPRVRPGRAAGFTFDGERRGWYARLPEATPMRLLTPSYGEGRVYVGGGFGSNQLYALDATSGRIDWMASAPDGGPTAAIIEDGKVLFNTESCTLFVVDAETGRARWSRWLGDPLMSQPAAANGRVFSGHVRDSGGYGFTAMDLESGRVLWTRTISADVMNAPVLDEDGVYFTTMDGVVWRLDQATGRRTWRAPIHATSAPWLSGDTVHVAKRETLDGRRIGEESVVLSKSDGAQIREHETLASFARGRPDRGGVEEGWAFEGSRPTIVDGRLYQTIGDEVQSRDAETGELLWRRRYAQRTHRRPASPPAVAGGQLVFGTTDGVLYGLDIDTGMTTWAYDVGAPITAQPTVARGWVFASTTRGTVVGLEVADASVGGWHMWGGDAAHNGPSEEPPLAQAEASDAGDPGFGTLELREGPSEGELAGFVLTGTRVEARIAGFAARVRVEQTFTNPYERAVEAVYLFPLPDDAAVDEMILEAGGRRVRGQIRRREEATREYRRARERGALASLLEQERPNLFRQSVANIRPGDAVRVVLTYSQVLPYEEGSYRFVFPMVAGPRYTPGDEAPITQVVLTDGGARRDRVDVRIVADLAGTLHEVTSPTHGLEVERSSERSARVTLEDLTPDRDLDVRFRVAGDEPSLGVLASPPMGDAPGYASLLVHPRLDVPEGEISPRELVVVIDTSSSMRGRPLELARAAALRAIAGLRETDTFRVVRFSDRASELSARALPATAENVERARRHLEEMSALGTTEMRRGLSAALAPAAEDDRANRIRIVALFTDGYIGNEAEVLREVSRELGQARVFAFGVGSAVNRYLLSRVAEVGRGEVSVVTLSESPEAAADAFHDRIGSPYLTDIEVDWGELPMESVYPRRAPDLFADRPLVLHGRYARGGRGEITVRGRIAGRAFEQTLEVELPSAGATEEARPEVRSLWARTRIRDLMTSMALRPSEATREEIIGLGIEHSLMTQWTSFVAIDEGYAGTGDGAPARVHQPSTLPSGVDYAGAARRMDVGGSALGSSTGGYGGGIALAAGSAGIRVPQIRTGSAMVMGSVSRESIRSTIQRQLPRVRTCYERRLTARPDLEGRITVSLLIATSGAVEAAVLESTTFGDPMVEECVLAVARTFLFPASDTTVRVNYPFVFARRRED